MEAIRVAHDEVFLQLEQPQRAHLLDDVRGLGHHAHVVDKDADDAVRPTEATPLVLRAGHQRVEIDDDVDLLKLGEQLRQLEREALDTDSHTPLRQLWKEEAANLLKLSIPVTLALMLEILPPILVSMMIGNVSGDASPQVLAGSSLSDFFQGQITSSLLMGLGAAVATLCAQSYGADQPRQFWIFAQAGLLASLYCLPPLAVVSVNGASLMTALGQEQELARVAGVLITVSLFSVPSQMIYMVARSALQAQNIAVPFVLVSLLSYMVSLPIGYYLGYHTSLGYVGIALSNIIANVLRAASVGPILLRNPLFRQSWPGWQWHDAHACVKRLWPLIAGSVLLIVFQSAGFFAISVLCGYLPHAAVAMASNNIASGLLSLGFLPMMGLAAGGTVRVGNALGAGAPRRASVASLVVVTESLVISLAGMTMMHGVATPYAAAFTSDNATLALSVQLTEYLIKVVPLVACVYATQSVFQACGAQWLCAKLNFLFLFAIGVPLGLVWALPWHGGVYGLWNGNMVAGATLVAVSITWVARIDWPAMAHEARCNTHLHVDREPSPEMMSTASSTYVLE